GSEQAEPVAATTRAAAPGPTAASAAGRAAPGGAGAPLPGPAPTGKIGRAHGRTPVTEPTPMPPSALKKKKPTRRSVTRTTATHCVRCLSSSSVPCSFFFTCPAPPQTSTLSLHDALPISGSEQAEPVAATTRAAAPGPTAASAAGRAAPVGAVARLPGPSPTG